MVLNTCRMESGGCEMNKEQLAKRVNGKVVLENKRTDVKEVLQVITASVYEEIETKKANN